MLQPVTQNNFFFINCCEIKYFGEISTRLIPIPEFIAKDLLEFNPVSETVKPKERCSIGYFPHLM